MKILKIQPWTMRQTVSRITRHWRIELLTTARKTNVTEIKHVLDSNLSQKLNATNKQRLHIHWLYFMDFQIIANVMLTRCLLSRLKCVATHKKHYLNTLLLTVPTVQDGPSDSHLYCLGSFSNHSTYSIPTLVHNNARMNIETCTLLPNFWNDFDGSLVRRHCWSCPRSTLSWNIHFWNHNPISQI